MSRLHELSGIAKKSRLNYCIGTPSGGASLTKRGEPKQPPKSRRNNISRTWANTSMNKSRVLARSLHNNNRTLAKKLNAVQVELAAAQDKLDGLREENEVLRLRTRFKDVCLEDTCGKLSDIIHLLVPLLGRVEEGLRGFAAENGDTFTLDRSPPRNAEFETAPKENDDKKVQPISEEGKMRRSSSEKSHEEEVANPFVRRDRIPRTPVHSPSLSRSSTEFLTTKESKKSSQEQSEILEPEVPLSPAHSGKSSPPSGAVLTSEPISSGTADHSSASEVIPTAQSVPGEPEPAMTTSVSLSGTSTSGPASSASGPSEEPLPHPQAAGSSRKRRKVRSRGKTPLSPRSPPAVIARGHPIKAAPSVYDFSMSETMNQTQQPLPSLSDLRAEGQERAKQVEIPPAPVAPKEEGKRLKKAKAKSSKLDAKADPVDAPSTGGKKTKRKPALHVRFTTTEESTDSAPTQSKAKESNDVGETKPVKKNKRAPNKKPKVDSDAEEVGNENINLMGRDARVPAKEAPPSCRDRLPESTKEKDAGLSPIGGQDFRKRSSKRRFKRIVAFDDSTDDSLLLSETPQKVRKKDVPVDETPMKPLNGDSAHNERKETFDALEEPGSSCRPRRTKPINFREPSMRNKLRRGDPKWCRDNIS